MESLPDLPPASETPELFEGGHLWLSELVVGAPVRFQVEATGRVVVVTDRLHGIGTREITDDPPPSLAHAVRYCCERLDRDALFAEADDPSGVTFAGVATRYEGVDYDFARLPGVIGTDVHSAARDRWLPPDVAERTFERLGIEPAPAVEKEVRAVDFDPAGFAFPASAYHDGPVAGVVVRNKTGGRAVIRRPGAGPDERDGADGGDDPIAGDVEAVAEAVVTPDRFARARSEAAAAGVDPDLDAVLERVLELVWREEHGRLPDLEERAFRSAVVEAVRATDG